MLKKYKVKLWAGIISLCYSFLCVSLINFLTGDLATGVNVMVTLTVSVLVYGAFKDLTAFYFNKGE